MTRYATESNEGTYSIYETEEATFVVEMDSPLCQKMAKSWMENAEEMEAELTWDEVREWLGE